MPLPDGIDDTGYLHALAATLPPLIDEVAPDIILYQGGVDPFAGDRLGRLWLSEEGLAGRDLLVADLALGRGLPLASTVGGGYGDDVLAIARRHVDVILRFGRAYEAWWNVASR